MGTDLEDEIEHDGDDAVRWGEGKRWEMAAAGHGIVLNAWDSDSVSKTRRRDEFERWYLRRAAKIAQRVRYSTYSTTWVSVLGL